MKVMASRLSSAMPSPEWMLTYNQFNSIDNSDSKDPNIQWIVISKLLWTFNQNTKYLIQENLSKCVSERMMVAIFYASMSLISFTPPHWFDIFHYIWEYQQPMENDVINVPHHHKNPSRDELRSGNIRYFHFLPFLNAGMMDVAEIHPHRKQGPVYPVYLIHVCWCPGDARSQGIDSHGIDCLVRPLHSGFSTTSRRINSLAPCDTIWRKRSGSTLAQVMACCLTAPSHYLNQCWLINTKVLWHSSEGIIMRTSEDKCK